MTTATDDSTTSAPGRSTSWRWYVCVLLLLATVVNYMDRLTTTTLSIEIQAEFDLSNEQYGRLELGFGLAFAAGSLLFGWLVDRIGVYWLYPVVLIGWSAMGFLTGLSRSYSELFTLRILLGIFESGHFPCGLKVVQTLLPPADRSLGNGMLQSGTALGAVLAPQVIRLLLTEGKGGWRLPFLVIGAGGTAWVVLWLASVRPGDIRYKTTTEPELAGEASGPSFWSLVFSGRFLALAIMVVCINLNWHLFRVWLPKFLREAKGFSRDEMLNFTTVYYIAADVGILSIGALTGWLARRWMTVYGARMTMFGLCCVLCTLTTAAARLDRGPLLLGSLLLVAFGSLGTFAAYYSLTQDLSSRHQGKFSGGLATIAWIPVAAFQPLFGRHLDQTRNYGPVFAAMGWLPMIGLVATLLLWKRDAKGAA